MLAGKVLSSCPVRKIPCIPLLTVSTLGSTLSCCSKERAKSEEEQVKAMALDIEKLKWRLIEQDQEAERQRRGGRLALKKSRSLEEESAGKGRRVMCVRACVMRDIINYCASVCTLSLVVAAKTLANVTCLYNYAMLAMT